MCSKGWWWLLHAGGVDEPPVAYGRPAHAQHVYLPYYQGQMTYTSKFTIFHTIFLFPHKIFYLENGRVQFYIFSAIFAVA